MLNETLTVTDSRYVRAASDSLAFTAISKLGRLGFEATKLTSMLLPASMVVLNIG